MLNDDTNNIDNLSLTTSSQMTSTMPTTAATTKSFMEASSSSSVATASTINKKNKPSAMEAFLCSVGDYMTTPKNIDPKAQITEELYNYRILISKYNVLYPPSTSSCFDFWKKHEMNFPLLSAMAKRFICTPATSIPAECAFSVSAYIGRKERARLSVESPAETIFLKVSIENETRLLRISFIVIVVKTKKLTIELKSSSLKHNEFNI